MKLKFKVLLALCVIFIFGCGVGLTQDVRAVPQTIIINTDLAIPGSVSIDWYLKDNGDTGIIILELDDANNMAVIFDGDTIPPHGQCVATVLADTDEGC